MDLMTPLNISQALAVALLILIGLYALLHLIGLGGVLTRQRQQKEEDEAALRDVRETDDPRS
jgi:hypothetical protein